MRILLTGGAGYIGSHTAVALIAAGYDVVCFDNFSNSKAEVLNRIELISGKNIPLVSGDVRDCELLKLVIRQYDVEGVVHFAGLKAVGEAFLKPIDYYSNNVAGSLSLIEAMCECDVKKLVFSSSATVYGQPQLLPLSEAHPTSATNPYGRTKLVVEEMLNDIALADPDWRIAILRYFNPVGAHASGLIGEDPSQAPNNLMPYISQVAAGKLQELLVFGDDYDTPDGTGVRDYIHVTDLAAGHVAALEAFTSSRGSVSTWNLGTGEGYSVLEVIEMFERINGVKVPYRIAPRRPGDVASTYASPAKAKLDLGWAATLGLEEMCSSSWNFERLLKTSNRFVEGG